MKKVKVAFVCVHNSCRSQMAEALSKLFASDVIEAHSAGTHVRPAINQDAVTIINELYQYNMNEHQHSKLIDELPPIDVVITMGCNVDCPYLPCLHREDWGLDDPTGKGKEAFLYTQHMILEKIYDLKTRILKGVIKIQ